MVASILNQVRKGGKTFRFGGEEFTLVFKNRTPEQIREELERLRVDVENEVIEVIEAGAGGKAKKQPGSKLVNVTVSMGVAEVSKEYPTAAAVLKHADEALYKAKKAGRNKVVVQPPAANNKTSKQSKKK